MRKLHIKEQEGGGFVCERDDGKDDGVTLSFLSDVDSVVELVKSFFNIKEFREVQPNSLGNPVIEGDNPYGDHQGEDTSKVRGGND